MLSKDAFRRYIDGFKYLLKLQWRTSGWLTVWQLLTSVLQGVSQIGSSYFNALILAQFALLVVGDSDVRTVMIVVVGRIIYQFVINGLFALDSYLQVKVGNLMKIEIEEEIIQHLHSLDQEQLESEEYNPIITRVREQLYQVGNMTRDFSSFIGEMFGFGAAIVSLFVIEPILGIVVAVIAIPLISMEVRTTKWRREAYDKTETDYRIRHAVRWYTSEYEYVPEIRMLNGLKDLLKVYRHHHRRIEEEEENIERKSLKLNIINNFTQLVVLLAGDVWLIFKAAAQALPLDTILFTRNLIQNAVNSSAVIARSSRSLSEGVVYLGDLQTFFAFKPAIKDGEAKIPKNEPLEIEFKNVSFAYPGSDVMVLKNASFKIAHDEKVALVGLNGAGKSTIVKLVLREYMPTSGEILVNGRPIHEYSFDSFISHVSVLMQNFVVIKSLTIRQNISMGNAGISDEKIHEALEIVNMSKFVSKLSKGLDSRLNSAFVDGVQISGGQEQRLFIARALLRQADFLVLDEPTSAIDARTEYTIFNELFNQKVKRSTLIISHRFSTVRKASKILVLDKGEIVESGTHEELMANEGLYFELFSKQAEGYK